MNQATVRVNGQGLEQKAKEMQKTMDSSKSPLRKYMMARY